MGRLDEQNAAQLLQEISTVIKNKTASKEEYEKLVRVIPTDVRAVVDQDELQLQMEHDSQVLAIDDNFGKTLSNFLLGFGEAYIYIGTIKTENPLITAGMGGHSYPFSVLLATSTAPKDFTKATLGQEILFLLQQQNSGYFAPKIYIEAGGMGLRYNYSSSIVRLENDETTTYSLKCLTTGESITNVTMLNTFQQ